MLKRATSCGLLTDQVVVGKVNARLMLLLRSKVWVRVLNWPPIELTILRLVHHLLLLLLVVIRVELMRCLIGWRGPHLVVEVIRGGWAHLGKVRVLEILVLRRTVISVAANMRVVKPWRRRSETLIHCERIRGLEWHMVGRSHMLLMMPTEIIVLTMGRSMVLLRVELWTTISSAVLRHSFKLLEARILLGTPLLRWLSFMDIHLFGKVSLQITLSSSKLRIRAWVALTKVSFLEIRIIRGLWRKLPWEIMLLKSLHLRGVGNRRGRHLVERLKSRL